QTEIYRARRHLIGETDYSRLATSPVLANLAVTTTGVQTSAVLQNLFQTQRAAPEPRTAMPLPGQGTPGPAGAAGGGIAGVGFDSFLADRRSLDLMSGAIGTRAFAASALGADLMTSASPLALSMRDITAPSLVGGATIDLRSAQ